MYLHHTISGESLLEDMNEKVQYATKKPRYIVEMCRAWEGVVSEVRRGGGLAGCYEADALLPFFLTIGAIILFSLNVMKYRIWNRNVCC